MRRRVSHGKGTPFGVGAPWSYVRCSRTRNTPAKKMSGSLMGEMRRSSTRPTTIQWSPAGCSATISHSRVARASVSSGAPPRRAPVEAGEAVCAGGGRALCEMLVLAPEHVDAEAPRRRMRDQVSERRDGQERDRWCGSSETDVSELTNNPVGSPSGAAVTKATPVANLAECVAERASRPAPGRRGLEPRAPSQWSEASSPSATWAR